MNSYRSQQGRKPAKRTRLPAPDLTREKLLEVAGPIFADRGYHAATIREICIEAGANIAAVNYHFGDKLGLYTEVLQQSVRAAQVKAVQNVLDQTHPLKTSCGPSFALDCEASPAKICRIGILDSWRTSWSADTGTSRTIDNVARPIYRRFLELIGEIIGLPPNDDNTRLCAISVVGQVLAYVLPGPLLTEIWPELRMTPDQVERIADHIADFSLSYLQDFRSKHGTMTPASKRRVSK